VFAGGDPSIHPDIHVLVDFAKALGLKVEIQTNAHHRSHEFLRSIRDSDLVGLSLDGPDAAIHDAFRNKPGNFQRVLDFMKLLDGWGTPMILRTVVTNLNYQSVSKIGELVVPIENVIRWSLLEFSAVGEGYVNRAKYEIGRDLFESVAEHTRAHFRGRAQIDVYRADAKVGTYALITPSGLAYGTGSPAIRGVFPVSGSILHDHLCEIAKKLPFSREKHLRRYGSLIQPKD